MTDIPRASDDLPLHIRKKARARLAAVQSVFQMEQGGISARAAVLDLKQFRDNAIVESEMDSDDPAMVLDDKFYARVVEGVEAHQARIDEEITRHLPSDWPFARLDTVVRAILRCGVYELAFEMLIPYKVILNEYIEVTKAFFDDTTVGFVNSVLNKVAHDVRDE